MGAPTKEELIARAWETGNLKFLLDPNQQKVYDWIKANLGGSLYFNKPRRIGGSYLLAVIALEYCLKIKNAQVKYLAPTAKAVRKIVNPNLRRLLKTCPARLKPKFDRLEGEWKFPHNDAILSLAGCDNQQYENLRGTEAHAVMIDEVGFMDELEYILNDVLMPQVQDTNGPIILTSTPPRSPTHASRAMAMAHKETGRYYHCTVWDNPRRTKKQHEDFFRKMAESKNMSLADFYESTTFRREYLGEFLADEERSVIPEWNASVEKLLVKKHRVPAYCDKYVSLDIGWRDGMGILFGYWDFNQAKLIIQDELLLFKKTAADVADAIKTKMIELWGSEKPYLMIADNDLQTIADINSHGLTFIPTRKDEKELQVNTTREWIRALKIVIDPRCRRLPVQLGGTIWNKQRNSYERDTEGHGDLLDALVYLVRNVRRDRNPYPARYGLPSGPNYLIIEETDDRLTDFQKHMLEYFEPVNE